jgi:hypothetical protein
MNDDQRFSILTFPQFFNGTDLTVNIVVLPRDQNPLSKAIEQHTTIDDAKPFADARLSFSAGIFDRLNVFPHGNPPVPAIPLEVSTPTNQRPIFEALASQLKIMHLNSRNSNSDLAAILPKFKPAAAHPEELTVKKYLPKSYRRSFNFTTARHKNAVTDDSYHCAVKDGQVVPGFKCSPDKIRWGKVYAHLMRQPLLARQAGMIYQTTLKNAAGHFQNGGWLYIDLAAGSDYYQQQLDSVQTFIRRYAARIPKLTSNTSRQVFAPLQFPVLASPSNVGNFDELFIEAAEYDDGFAKIIHCQQPPNRDLLVEDNDGSHPVKDVGIRLGWDDEQILIWYIRQMSQVQADPSVRMNGRLDAPLGVFGYNIDVRETASPENPWESLNFVESKQLLTLSNSSSPAEDPVSLGTFKGELPYQVYPMQLDGRKKLNYWLPMYFADWVGHSMVLPDPDAAAIYQTTNKDMKPDPVITESNTGNNLTGTGVSGPAENQLSRIYKPGTIATKLRYGNNYEFRIRMQDLSGGTPDLKATPVNETPSATARCRFKRFISPNQPCIQEMETLVNKDTPTGISELNIQRPKLGYPAVIYTGKYADPVKRLVDQAKLGIQKVDTSDRSKNAEHRVGLGIADPDVDRLEITVEIASLKLDKLDSVSGKDDYVHLYTTYRRFPLITSDDDYEANLHIPIEYSDVKVLHTGDKIDLINDFHLTDNIDNLTELYLPTGRTVRFTIRAVCEKKGSDKNYYGFIDEENKQLDNRYGEFFQILAYSPSVDETDLLVKTAGIPVLQGIYMQPDVVTAFDGRLTTLLMGKMNGGQRSNVQLLADKLNIDGSRLTLSARKGERVVFGCSSRIRHTLAPDNSSLTFASKGDLMNHWLCCISFEINRDWMWDAVENRSFVIQRSKEYPNDKQAEKSDVVAGDIEMVRTASFESLHNPGRSASRIIFIDAVEPKKAKPENGAEPGFPDIIKLSYSIEVNFKTGHAQQQDVEEILELLLPITTAPAQVPKIVSAGIALSPYVRNESYSASEARRRHLWIEFEEPVKDPKDTYFARVLAVAPDQLLSHNDPELLAAPEEPALPIDPEYIRVINRGAANDLAGLQAMQPMEKSTTSDRHYLLPLPPGLHAESDEMFGFFTYELRLGHYKKTDTGEMVWTTAQGRFGRRLRATGIQHPAPTLTCMPNRDEDKLWVTAPYAVAVHEGKNVTADPPRSQLWALLYAQVTQADNRDYRNILLDDRRLDWRVQVEPHKDVDVLGKYNDEQLQLLRSIAFKNFKYEINTTSHCGLLELVDFSTKSKDATKYGTVVWSNSEITRLLFSIGLPQDSALSVLVVETLPQITNIFEHISRLDKEKVAQAAGSLAGRDKDEFKQWIIDEAKRMADHDADKKSPSPVSDELGHHRLLRTSPLTEVPDICSYD